MSDSIHTVFASVQPHHVPRKERQMHRSANLAAGIRMPSRDISAHPTPYNSFNKPPASRWRCNPSNHISANCLHIILFLFYQGEIIARRLAQSIVYSQLFRGRRVVNKEVDLVALLSQSSTRGDVPQFTGSAYEANTC